MILFHIINLLVILFLFFIIGYLVRHIEGMFVYIKAIVLGSLFIVLSYFTLIVSSLTAIFIIFSLLGDGVNSLFQIGLIVMLFSGIMLYLIFCLFNTYFDITYTLITIIEYFIQWLLIYFTLYQFVTNQLASIKDLSSLDIISNLLSPDILNLFMLPALLVSWIAISMIKMSKLN